MSHIEQRQAEALDQNELRLSEWIEELDEKLTKECLKLLGTLRDIEAERFASDFASLPEVRRILASQTEAEIRKTARRGLTVLCERGLVEARTLYTLSAMGKRKLKEMKDSPDNKRNETPRRKRKR